MGQEELTQHLTSGQREGSRFPSALLPALRTPPGLVNSPTQPKPRPSHDFPLLQQVKSALQATGQAAEGAEMGLDLLSHPSYT